MLLTQGTQVQSLVRVLRSHMPWGTAKNLKKKKKNMIANGGGLDLTKEVL